MKHLVFKILLSISLLCCISIFEVNSQLSKFDYASKDGFSMDLMAGYPIKKGNVPITMSMTINKCIINLSVGLPLNNGRVGPDYGDVVGWNEYPEDETGKEDEYSFPIELGLGYRIWKNIAVGVGVAYVQEYRFKNMYDEYNILGDNGYYHLSNKYDSSIAANVFVNIYIPLNSTGSAYLVVQPKYSSYYDFILSGGFGFTL